MGCEDCPVTRRQDWRLICSDNRLSHRGGKYNCTSRAQNKPLVRAGFSQEFGDFGSCPRCLFGLGAVSAAPECADCLRKVIDWCIRPDYPPRVFRTVFPVGGRDGKGLLSFVLPMYVNKLGRLLLPEEPGNIPPRDED